MDKSAWDEALQRHTLELVDALLAASGQETPRESCLPVLRNLRRFIEDTSNKSEASSVLATTLQLVLNPSLHTFYPRDMDDASTEELIEIFCEFGGPIV